MARQWAMHCTSNPRVSSINLHRVCPVYSDLIVRAVPLPCGVVVVVDSAVEVVVAADPTAEVVVVALLWFHLPYSSSLYLLRSDFLRLLIGCHCGCGSVGCSSSLMFMCIVVSFLETHL